MHARVLDELRTRIARIPQVGRPRHPIVPFGITAIDARLPRGGLARGALHEAADGGRGAEPGAAALLFVAGVLARMKGSVLWCLRARDLFAPALSGAGLHPDRVIYAEALDEKTVLLCLEEGLRHGGLAAVVGEVSRLSMTASRRLQLRAEASGVTAFVIRRWRNAASASDFGQPTAAATRWRITPVPSSPLPVPGIGRPRWRVELMRCRGGECAEWEVEACDAQGRLALPADLAERSAAATDGRCRASA
ncbi:MAG: damage-inducible mutagenesis protein [Rhodospirillales bacterium]